MPARLYDFLPFTIRDGDVDKALETFFGAVQQEFERLRDEVRYIAVLVDPDGLNQRYSLEGRCGAGPSLPTNQIRLPANASSENDFYVGKWARIVGGTGAKPIKTRRIIAYDGTTKVATIEGDWGLTRLSVVDEFQTRTSGTTDVDPFVSTLAHDDVVPGTLVVKWAGAAPIFTPLIESHDDGVGNVYGAQYGGYDLAGTINYETGALSIRRTSGGYVEDASVRVSYSYIGPLVPDSTSYVGILDGYASLAFLADQVGVKADADDPEILLREQIKNAVPVYKLRGSDQSFDVLFRSFGFDVSIVPLWSNYEHAPRDLPGVADPTWTETRRPPGPGHVYVPREGGEDEASAFIAAEGSGALVSDSHVVMFLSRRHPDVAVTVDSFLKLRKRIEDIRPIHVQIALGLLERADEELTVDDSDFAVTVDWDSGEEGVTVDDSDLVIFIGGYMSIEEPLTVADELEVRGPTRWDRTGCRWDRSKSRWDVGTTYFKG